MGVNAKLKLCLDFHTCNILEEEIVSRWSLETRARNFEENTDETAENLFLVKIDAALR